MRSKHPVAMNFDFVCAEGSIKLNESKQSSMHEKELGK